MSAVKTAFTRTKRFFYVTAGATILGSFMFTGNALAATNSPANTNHSAYYYGYSSIERLWMAAGGSWATASRAACIASHESGGNPDAISPTNDYGLFQIHDGGYAMLNPYANARRAVAMSDGGLNWSAWTTSYMC